MKKPKNQRQLHWLVRPRTIRLLWWWGCGILAVVTLLGLAIHPHAYFGLDGWWAFNSVYGFLTCAAMVVGAKALAIFLKRKDTYYDN